ncbi:TPA: hypothetical protein NPO92_004755 [Klebsiella quasipneumoniae subsp. quasipneumoniae]|nr:hypothetical protein [Klebsiella quasipneumoniae subsp. quasipneumoniae]
MLPGKWILSERQGEQHIHLVIMIGKGEKGAHQRTLAFSKNHVSRKIEPESPEWQAAKHFA